MGDQTHPVRGGDAGAVRTGSSVDGLSTYELRLLADALRRRATVARTEMVNADPVKAARLGEEIAFCVARAPVVDRVCEELKRAAAARLLRSLE